eukprot:CAMPEP_0197058318 /NCGR_PEP_ID=MMETSP1384-20130603/106351_1 /TAXON_ID=29189 /ORGANISM="Ammonia sp." /LENGTH=75 /DNA_ID=CAMNT_0042493025 /DNA_START=97 /DNA_END=324 /DNA_ORIENTATION=-
MTSYNSHSSIGDEEAAGYDVDQLSPHKEEASVKDDSQLTSLLNVPGHKSRKDNTSKEVSGTDLNNTKEPCCCTIM